MNRVCERTHLSLSFDEATHNERIVLVTPRYYYPLTPVLQLLRR